MYTFSIGWFFLGMLIMALSAAVVVFHRPLADNLASGVSSYERFKLWGLIGCGVGLLVMLNLHTLILGIIFDAIFP